MTQAKFITFEGIDGSGKSTQARNLFDTLTNAGIPCIFTREPGGSQGAEIIRKLLVEGDPDRWSAETEILLFNAARRDHLEKTILPALAAGKSVICDRFVDSTRVYQGVARADLRPMVDQMHALMIGREADLTIIIDIDPKAALTRGLARQSGEDRFEDMGLEFQQKLRAGFLELAQSDPKRCAIVDGTGSMDTVAQRVKSSYDERLR